MELPESWRVSDRPAGAPRWVNDADRRPYSGVRLGPDADPKDPLVRARAAGLVLPVEGALGGWAGAALLGVPPAWLDGRARSGEALPVGVIVPPPRRVRGRRGCVVSHAPLDGDVIDVGGIPVTSGVRTTFDLLRTAPNLRQAVARGDACVRFRLTTQAAIRAYVAQRPGWRGVTLARQAAALLDGRSESPMESELRVIWLVSGLGVPVPQETILDELGVIVARVDLLDPVGGVVGEYMGAWHRDGRQPWQDTVRGRGLDQLGLEVVEIWSPDVAQEARAIDLLRVGYARAGRRPRADRTYLILR